jgi:DNA segregation ATPase FtsK/SpoIIIE, S-DNA-T family
MIDSRTILDTPGANQLIGKGDMLISSGSTMTRVQCAFIDTPEVENVCKFISSQRGFPTAFLLPEVETDQLDGGTDSDLSNKDELFEDAARLVVIHQSGSTSLIQRKLAIGYNRAGRIMDQLEKAGIVGPGEGSKPRQVFIQDEYSLEQLLRNI